MLNRGPDDGLTRRGSRPRSCDHNQVLRCNQKLLTRAPGDAEPCDNTVVFITGNSHNTESRNNRYPGFKWYICHATGTIATAVYQ